MVRSGNTHFTHKSALSATMNGVGVGFSEGKHSVGIGKMYTEKKMSTRPSLF